MTLRKNGPGNGQNVLVIGAGIGGLASACRLSELGFAVTVVERHAAPGGKMRTMPSDAGPVDAGPTVLTLRPILDALFAAMGERVKDHLDLVRQPVIARHFWPDGSRLDLFDSPAANIEAIRGFAGPKAAQQFQAFSDRARALFNGFDGPMMQSPQPSHLKVGLRCMMQPSLISRMAPMATLDRLLKRSFDDPRLVQLFGRYATYVGGTPDRVPALLALIWQAEAAGVWKIDGGMHRLAQTLESLARARGTQFLYSAPVAEITCTAGRATGVLLEDGDHLSADLVVFNGDPRALATGALGPDATQVAPQTRTVPRSLSAQVWAFAARPSGVDLLHHNVFFRQDPAPEFEALENGALLPDPTLYVCAMDRGGRVAPEGPERFEIIANAPPLPSSAPSPDPEFASCHTRTFQTLKRFGLTFNPAPIQSALTTPQMFETLFPGSLGALYGQSPQGTTAAFRRPTARTPLPGLYLTGGGAHPGAGVPMAILSARHAVETILTDRTSTSMSRQMDMHGGTSTA